MTTSFCWKHREALTRTRDVDNRGPRRAGAGRERVVRVEIGAPLSAWPQVRIPGSHTASAPNQCTSCDAQAVRLQRGVEVAGVDPEVAREVVRLCRGNWRFPEFVAKRLDTDLAETVDFLKKLEAEGFLERGEEI